MGDGLVIKLVDTIKELLGIEFAHGTKRDFERAVKSLIDEIERNDTLHPLAKASAIASARRQLKEYLNQQEIMHMSLQMIDSIPQKTLLPDDTIHNHDNWYEYFFNKAKNICSEEFQKVWAAILAGAFISKNNLSFQLVDVLFYLTPTSASIFSGMCRKTILVRMFSSDVYDDNPSPYFDPVPLFSIVHGKSEKWQRGYEKLIDLGLIIEKPVLFGTFYQGKEESLGAFICENKKYRISLEDNFKDSIKGIIPPTRISDVCYSTLGKELFNLLFQLDENGLVIEHYSPAFTVAYNDRKGDKIFTPSCVADEISYYLETQGRKINKITEFEYYDHTMRVDYEEQFGTTIHSYGSV